MIFGEPIRFDGRFGENMGQFLGLINSASATYKGSQIEINGKITDNSETRFNLNSSILYYRTSLIRGYENSLRELENTLSETYNKFDKLFLIVQIITEVESFNGLLTKTSDGVYLHKLFEFINLSEDKIEKEKIYTETNFQEYYKWMDHYLKKTLSFLINLKEITEKTNQTDFVLPKSMLLDKNTSTKSNPLEYFEYLFNRQGFFYLKQSFIPSEEDCLQGDAYYNHETETITYHYQDNETGEWEESESKFTDYYYKRLYSEYQISQKKTDEHICDLKDEASVTFFIKLTLSKLKYLKISIDRNNDAKKYEDSKRPINGLINFIHEKYADFIPKDMLGDTVKVDSLDSNKSIIPQQNLLPSPKKTVTTFKWNSKSDMALSTALWQSLKDAKIISKSTELDVFHKAFNGSIPDNPLRIHWTAIGKNKLINKCLIFYLLDKLAEKNLIEENTDNPTFISTLGFVFCNSKGELLLNLNVSNSSSSKKRKTKTPDEIKIDEIIVALEQIAAEK